MKIEKIEWVLAAAFLCVGGCSFNPNAGLTGAGGTIGGTGGSGGSPAPPGLTALTISPATATLSISQGGPAGTQQYKVTGTVNGQQRDMTSQVSYSTSPSGVVGVSGGGLATTTGALGGVVTITASSGTYTATATLTVNFTFVGPDPGMTSTVPPNAPGLFTTTANDPSRAPQLIYPNDGVLFPPNVSGIEIHFMPGANNTLFEVDLLGPVSSVKSYIRCTAPSGITGCIYLPDPGLWASVAQSNAGQGQVQLFVRGTDDNGTSVGNSQTFHLQFSKDDIMGALYYWTTSGKTAIMRWDFGGSTKTAAQYLTPANTDGTTCVGCHALSPDGTKLVASAGGQNDGRLLLWNASTGMPQQPFPLTQRSQFESWNSDGTQFVGMYGDANPNHKGPVNLMLFDGTSGAVTQTIDLGGLRADHPDWSKSTTGPNTIAFTSVDATAPTTDQRPATGGIDFIQQTGGAWGQPQTLVPSQLGKNRYYPAIAPDGNLLIYDESTCTSGTPKMGQAPDKSCDADTDATATIFLTSLGGAAPVALANANSPGVGDNGATALTNSFPKWAPFIEQLDEMRQVLWFTFSSTRQYGLRSPPAPADTGETTKGTLIWMVGVVLGPGSADPSFTAFCLPFQDITTSNHIAQWTKTFVNIVVDKP
ncbi:MAG TPA: hypothetical protein VKZ18_13395 [Polyangia bacterium]|nr:hypothetical protein [Polyangia bacterium]